MTRFCKTETIDKRTLTLQLRLQSAKSPYIIIPTHTFDLVTTHHIQLNIKDQIISLYVTWIEIKK